MWPLVTLPYFIVRKVLYKNYFKILFVRMEYFITFVTDRMLIISTDWFVQIYIFSLTTQKATPNGMAFFDFNNLFYVAVHKPLLRPHVYANCLALTPVRK